MALKKSNTQQITIIIIAPYIRFDSICNILIEIKTFLYH
jgi:hypothetical protein